MGSFFTGTVPFVGRQDELAQISDLLADSNCRLLTLVGLGGIGKTRLAVETMRQLCEPEQTFFVPLQPLTSAEFIVSTIAEGIDFQFYSGTDPKQQLLDYLREKSWLLVLDNFEHLLDGATLLSEILDAAPGIRLLVTSRERINLTEKWALDIGGLEQNNAVQLFGQHAQRAKVGFSLTDQNNAIERICHLVGGMPLALELAASWVRALSCETIADEIERSLDILETPARNIEPRHRTMRATFGPTWERLTDHGRDVFMKLSVFRGGFTHEAAKEVAGASLRTLSALVDQSLLRVDAKGRYDVHELLRQYGEEQLNESPEECERVLGLHSAYFAAFLRDHPTETRVGLDAVQGEIDNVYLAMNTMIEQRRVADLGKSLESLGVFFNGRPRPHKAVEWFGRVVDALRPIASDRETALLLGMTLALLAQLHMQIGTPEQGLPIAEESLRILRPLDSPDKLLYALDAQVWMLVLLNRLDETQAATEEGLRVAREIDNAGWTASFLRDLGHFLLKQGQYAQARQLGEEALSFAQQASSQEKRGQIIEMVLGPAAYEMGDYTAAKRYFEQGLQLYEEFEPNEGYFTARSHGGLGDVALAQQDFADARWRYQQQTRILVERGIKQADALWSLLSVVKLLRAEGEKEAAVEILTLIIQHPATMPITQKQAEGERGALEAELAPEVYAAAVERGCTRNYNAVVQEIIAGFSQNVEDAVAKPPASLPQPLGDPLTAREREVVCLIADGFSNREIAERFVVEVSTVKWYLHRIFGKLDVTSRTQAVARARTLGLLS